MIYSGYFHYITKQAWRRDDPLGMDRIEKLEYLAIIGRETCDGLIPLMYNGKTRIRNPKKAVSYNLISVYDYQYYAC